MVNVAANNIANRSNSRRNFLLGAFAGAAANYTARRVRIGAEEAAVNLDLVSREKNARMTLRSLDELGSQAEQLASKIFAERNLAMQMTGLPPVLKTENADFYFWLTNHGTEDVSALKENLVPEEVFVQLLNKYPRLLYVPETDVICEAGQEQRTARYLGRGRAYFDLLEGIEGRFVPHGTTDFLFGNNVQVLYLDSHCFELLKTSDALSAFEKLPARAAGETVYWSLPMLWGGASGRALNRRGFFWGALAVTGAALEGRYNPFSLSPRKLASFSAESEMRKVELGLWEMSTEELYNREIRSALVAYKLLAWLQLYKNTFEQKPALLISFGALHVEIVEHLKTSEAEIFQKIAKMAKYLEGRVPVSAESLTRGFLYSPSPFALDGVAVESFNVPSLADLFPKS
jgi:hypothetical protein